MMGFTVLANELVCTVQIDGGDLIPACERSIHGVESAGPNCIFMLAKLLSR